MQNQPQIICQIENWHPVLNTVKINDDIIVAERFYGALEMDPSERYRFCTYLMNPVLRHRPRGFVQSHYHVYWFLIYLKAVHMLNQTNQFYLPTTADGACPSGLMFDFIAHLLWIRAKNKSNKICAYRYIKRLWLVNSVS